MPNAPAAIRAAFAEWRMVKSRKVLQLVFEVPLETQGEVLTMLGAPMPDKEIWCGIARLQTATEIARNSNAAQSQMDSAPPPSATPAAERPGVEPSSPSARARASQFAKERYQEASPISRALTRAALLAKDERFQAWVKEQDVRYSLNDEAAAHYIREHCCNGGSRGLIAEDPEAYRKFLALETMFKIAVGEIAEPR